jgi:hypothetical protein
MKEIKKSAIRVATEEIIEKIGLTTPNEQGEKVPITFDDNTSDQEVEQVFKDAVGYIDPVLDKSKFSIATKIIIHNYDPKLFPEVEATVKEVKKETTPELLEVEPADDLFTQINSCERLKDLKAIAQTNTEFKGLRGRLNSYKSLDDLHDAMVDVLNSGEPQVVADRLHEQNIESQGVNGGEKKEKPAEEKQFKAKMEVVPTGDKKEATLVSEKKVKAEKKEKVAKKEPKPLIEKTGKTRATVMAKILQETVDVPMTIKEIANRVQSEFGGSENEAKYQTKVAVSLLSELKLINEQSGKLSYKG